MFNRSDSPLCQREDGALSKAMYRPKMAPRPAPPRAPDGLGASNARENFPPLFDVNGTDVIAQSLYLDRFFLRTQ